MKLRGFEPVDKDKWMNVDNYLLPKRSTSKSSGYDFYSPIDICVHPGSKKLIWTNIKAYMQDDEVLQIYIRSSVGIKKGLVLANQVAIIDADYHSNPDNDGNIGICLYNRTNETIMVKAGERIAQGIFVKYLVADNCNSDNERIGGIGSTNEK
jgi:dUTP pyrophosphatase